MILKRNLQFLPQLQPEDTKGQTNPLALGTVLCGPDRTGLDFGSYDTERSKGKTSTSVRESHNSVYASCRSLSKLELSN
jgi:hypothetical protein